MTDWLTYWLTDWSIDGQTDICYCFRSIDYCWILFSIRKNAVLQINEYGQTRNNFMLLPIIWCVLITENFVLCIYGWGLPSLVYSRCGFVISWYNVMSFLTPQPIQKRFTGYPADDPKTYSTGRKPYISWPTKVRIYISVTLPKPYAYSGVKMSWVKINQTTRVKYEQLTDTIRITGCRYVTEILLKQWTRDSTSKNKYHFNSPNKK